jgi:hypothetical protein
MLLLAGSQQQQLRLVGYQLKLKGDVFHCVLCQYLELFKRRMRGVNFFSVLAML